MSVSSYINIGLCIRVEAPPLPKHFVIVKDTLVLLHLNTDTFLLWKNRVPGWMGKNSI
ncbi:hypothetical protein NC651_015554 [Populus alba x Populus x berolinensis]|nr:hypothetical protein NC651_015554 [Populus alba x Populus x berolinensis]